jgi:hypothetical protein
MVAGPAPDAGRGGAGSGAEGAGTPASERASGVAAVTEVASENWAGYDPPVRRAPLLACRLRGHSRP